MKDIIYKRIQLKRLVEDEYLDLGAYYFFLELKAEHVCKPGFLVSTY
jgi:hypothetical protein